MAIDPIVLSSLTSAITLISHEYAKGVCNEAGKTTWNAIKQLFSWHLDPPLAEIPQKVSDAISSSPDLASRVVAILKNETTEPAASLVNSISITGGKAVFAHTIETLNM